MDFSDAALTQDGVARVADTLAQAGTVAFLPTVVTSSPETYRAVLPLLAKACTEDSRVMGIHLEGPFISVEDGAVGAHPKQHVREPSVEGFRELQGLAGGKIRLVTLAPECPGALKLIEYLVAEGVVVSVGHTLADPRRVEGACLAGATLATHLGNGIPNELNRTSNTLWSIVASPLSVMLITDGFHTPPDFVKAVYAAKGAGKIILTSDASPVAGLPLGEYESLRRKGHTHGEISELLDVSESAVRKWWSLYRRGGMRALRLGRRGRRKGACRSLSPEQERRVKRMIIDKTPEQLKMPFALWTRQAVQELIETTCELRMPIRSVGNYLLRWGFTPQRPRKRAYEQQPAAIKQWLRETYPTISNRAKQEGGQIHWCDQTGISSADHRGRGYAPQGRTPIAGTQAARFSASMISTITNRGKLRFMVYRRGLKIATFIKFLRRLIRCTDRKVFLILDNLQVHRAKKVRAWVAERNEQIELFCLPPYCPELNPDEYLNNTVKAQLRKQPAPRSQDQLQGNLRSRMRSNQRRPHLIRSLFDHPSVKYAAA